MEKEIQINSNGLWLEAAYKETEGNKAALITHPHPLYGGNMHNNVVLTLRDAFVDLGISTLRFNFRGVGRSEGSFGNGIEEQRDVESAIRFLMDKGKERIIYSGYSFGAWVIFQGLSFYPRPESIVLVSLPVAFIPLGNIPSIEVPLLLITGEQDEIAPKDMLKDILAYSSNGSLKIIQRADHFFWGREQDLYRIVLEHFALWQSTD